MFTRSRRASLSSSARPPPVPRLPRMLRMSGDTVIRRCPQLSRQAQAPPGGLCPKAVWRLHDVYWLGRPPQGSEIYLGANVSALAKRGNTKLITFPKYDRLPARRGLAMAWPVSTAD